MTNGSGGWDGPGRGGPNWDDQWSGRVQGPPPGQGYGYGPESRRGLSGGLVAVITLLVVLILLLGGLVAYLLLRPEDEGAASRASDGPGSAVPWSTPPPQQDRAEQAPAERETVTETRQAPPEQSPAENRAESSGHPSGADRSGWISNRQARCNAGDPAAMIGRTTQASFSICINPDNGRYYYRGSSGGAGVEVDDPVVSGSTARVSNNDVVYAIDAGEMVIYQGGAVISRQPMVDFWTG